MRWSQYNLLLIIFLCAANCSYAQKHSVADSTTEKQNILPADCRINIYLPLLKGKKVAVLSNQTARINDELLVDTLLKRGVKVTKIFVPEHGFRGQADAGAHIGNSIDSATGLSIISLYGKNKKPTQAQLAGVDIVIYDLQDVGVRFYTYISTLQYVMEACAENNKELMVLDRPDPNGFYVDGPVLDTALRSFVGMQPIPIVYGMTAGEYAKMLVGERWFHGASKLNLKVIPCAGYDHNMKYELPVVPSPNLRNMAAVYVYPSLCLFEGTPISVGRGTAMPFQMWGHPDLYGKFIYYFTPQKTEGASSPLYENRVCYGQIAAVNATEGLKLTNKMVRLFWLIKAYNTFPYKDDFFKPFFDKLAGNTILKEQIKKGMSEAEIHATWQKDINNFKKIRKKYLLYKDFED